MAFWVAGMLGGLAGLAADTTGAIDINRATTLIRTGILNLAERVTRHLHD